MFAIAALLAAAAPGIARAQVTRPDPIVVPVPAVSPRDSVSITRTIYLDRCVGGCTVYSGENDDATTNTSSIPSGGPYTLAAFAYTDAEWQAIVTCVQQVYSPYDVQIVDTEPTSGVYNKTFVAGSPEDIGEPAGTYGIAVIAGDCGPLSDSIAFAFANAHPHDDTFVDNVCWTAAQESAHLYGLDHEYVFTDGVSACSDPMTYRADCNGQKFFRPYEAYCGTVAQAPSCRCTPAQSSHHLLLLRFGAGTPTSSPPTVSLVSPTAPGTLADGASIVAYAGAQRGIDHVELLLNGYPWVTVPGVAFEEFGQPSANYTLTLPADVPDGIIDVQVAAFDDLGISTTTQTLTMTKGAPCTSAQTCAANQTCNGGRCEYPAATQNLGDACDYVQQCTTNMCVDGTCTQACDIDDDSTCPESFRLRRDRLGYRRHLHAHVADARGLLRLRRRRRADPRGARAAGARGRDPAQRVYVFEIVKPVRQRNGLLL